MLNLNRTRVLSMAVHFVGNPLKEEQLQLSQQAFQPDEFTEKYLKQYLQNAFPAPDYYRFFHESGVEHNAVAQVAGQLLEDSEQLVTQSQTLAQRLFDHSQAPQIKGGELLVLYLKDVELEDHLADAIAIFKAEEKQPFLFTDQQEDYTSLHSFDGIHPGKVDKACLIHNREAEEGYYVMATDNRNRGSDAKFWFDEFLRIERRDTSFHRTSQLMELSKNFIDEGMGQEESEVDRAEKIALLQKSSDYFKEHDTVDRDNFGLEVFEDPAVADSFRAYTEERTGFLRASSNWTKTSTCTCTATGR